jgi:hypothetical protein
LDNDKPDIKAKDIKKLMLILYRRYRTGEITGKQALIERDILNSILHAIKITDFENRLIKIEEILHNGRK